MGKELNFQNLFKDLTKNLNELQGLSTKGKDAEEIKPSTSDLTSIFKKADASDEKPVDANIFMNATAAFYDLGDLDVDSEKYKELDEKFGKFFDEIEDLDGVDGLSYDDIEAFTEGYTAAVEKNDKSSDKGSKTNAVLGEQEAEIAFDNGSKVGINLRDDLVSGSQIDGDAKTGKFSITFGKTSKVDDTKPVDDDADAKEAQAKKEAEEKAAQEKVNAEKIANAFNYDKTDAPQSGRNLQTSFIIDKPLNYTFDIPQTAEPGAKAQGTGDYGTGRKDDYVAEYGEDGKLSKITTTSPGEPDKVLEEVYYSYDNDGSYTETLHDKGTGCVIETTYNPDGTINTHKEYMSEDDKNDDNPNIVRNYTYSVNDEGNPVQTIKNNNDITVTTTYNIADNTYTQHNSHTDSDTVLKGSVEEEVPADETSATDKTDETPATDETDETPATDETDETPSTDETDETPATDETDEAPAADETPNADGKLTGDKVDYEYTDANGKTVTVNVKDGWSSITETDDKIQFVYPDGSVKTIGKGTPADNAQKTGNGDEDDKGNGYSVPDGSKPEYVVNVGGNNISIDIPDELRNEIQTVINTKTGEVSFKDKNGNEIKAEDINALVKGTKADKTDNVDKSDKPDKTEKTDKADKTDKVDDVDDEGEVDKTASLFKKDDRIKNDEKGNKYAEVTAWNNNYSENNCLYRIIDHSYDLDAMGIPRDEKGYPVDTDPKYVALEKAIMNANPEIYGNENGGWRQPPGKLQGRRNAMLNVGEKIVLPEAYDIKELGIERPKVKKEDPEKTEDPKKTDEPKKTDVKDSNAEVALDTKNGTVVIDVEDDFFNSSKNDLNVKGDTTNDEITIDAFKEESDETISFDEYQKQANSILNMAYNKDAIAKLKNTVQNDNNLSQEQKDTIMAMFPEEE